MSAAQPGPAQPGPAPDGAPQPEVSRRSRRNRIILWTVLAVVLVALVLLAASFLPRWWAQTVGGLVDGSFGRGAFWGLAFGIVFTLVPTLFVARAVRRWNGWKKPVTFIAAGVLLAAPNLFTLWVVVGTTSAAHAAERTMDVNAPFFRGATAWGVLVGLAAGVAIELLWRGWRERGRKLDAIRKAERDPGSVGD
ncbi:hypothetical protein [Xylanimonas cellulosilytica]|nr:hypothetical protein [Xylanimonas cellulosilytica]